MRVDIYCKVVDNWGDAGFCWRLARHLHHFEQASVRLIVDGLDTFTALGVSSKIAQQFGVELIDWASSEAAAATASPSLPDILINAFACDLPTPMRQSIREQAQSNDGQHCLWINLEYLSAEGWVDSHHWKPSTKPDGAMEMFYMPGFTTTSGGILGDDFVSVSDEALLDTISLHPKQPGERWASLFCYPNAPLDLFNDVSVTLKLLVPANIDLSTLHLPNNHPVQIHRIPHLTQPQYDALLRYCDFNFVRGEDSWVRAQLAGKPFIWQPYVQSENTHLVKLEAFCDAFEVVATKATGWRAAMLAWSNTGLAPPSPIASLLNKNQGDFARFCAEFSLWQTHLKAQSTLTTRLMQAHRSWLQGKAAT
jgi:uncharacterized repeat protein (TIGR03837 family)